MSTALSLFRSAYELLYRYVPSLWDNYGSSNELAHKEIVCLVHVDYVEDIVMDNREIPTDIINKIFSRKSLCKGKHPLRTNDKITTVNYQSAFNDFKAYYQIVKDVVDKIKSSCKFNQDVYNEIKTLSSDKNEFKNNCFYRIIEIKIMLKALDYMYNDIYNMGQDCLNVISTMYYCDLELIDGEIRGYIKDIEKLFNIRDDIKGSDEKYLNLLREEQSNSISINISN